MLLVSAYRLHASMVTSADGGEKAAQGGCSEHCAARQRGRASARSAHTDSLGMPSHPQAPHVWRIWLSPGGVSSWSRPPHIRQKKLLGPLQVGTEEEEGGEGEGGVASAEDGMQRSSACWWCCLDGRCGKVGEVLPECRLTTLDETKLSGSSWWRHSLPGRRTELAESILSLLIIKRCGARGWLQSVDKERHNRKCRTSLSQGCVGMPVRGCVLRARSLFQFLSVPCPQHRVMRIGYGLAH